METKQMFPMPFFVLSFLTNRRMLLRYFGETPVEKFVFPINA